MKRIMLGVLVCMLNVSLLQAQVPLEARRTMSKGSESSFSYPIDSLNARETEKLWLDFLAEYQFKKPIKDRKTGEIFAADGLVPALSSNILHTYSMVHETATSSAELVVWFELGGTFFSASGDSDKIAPVESFFKAFAAKTRVRQVELELLAAENTLKELNKEFAKLEREKAALEKIITDAERKIEGARESLRSNAASQSTQMEGIEGQQRIIEQVKEKLQALKLKE